MMKTVGVQPGHQGTSNIGTEVGSAIEVENSLVEELTPRDICGEDFSYCVQRAKVERQCQGVLQERQDEEHTKYRLFVP